MSMTRKDYLNCADAISNLTLGGSALNEVIAVFSTAFKDKYDNFDPMTFRNYIINKSEENRNKRLNDGTSPELKLIE